jgi:hypothetical protein
MLNNTIKSHSYYPEGGYNDIRTKEAFDKRHYVGKYQNFWERRERNFCVKYADEIPASACSIKIVFGKNVKEAFKNYINKNFNL